MSRMGADTELRFDASGDAPTCPDRATEAAGFSALLEQGPKVGEVGRAQQGGGPGRRMGAQRIHASKRGAFEPLAESPLCHAQGFSDPGLRPSPLVQFPSTEAAAFVPAQRRFRICCAHAAEQSTFRPMSIRSPCADQ